MKLGISIRHDMGNNVLINSSKELVEFLKQFKNISFFEITCQYPLPLNLLDDISVLKEYLAASQLSVGLNFPVQFHDQWKLKKGFAEVRDIILNFAEAADAFYVNIHPESLAYFTEQEAKDKILQSLIGLKQKTKKQVTVMNGHSVFQTPEDLNFFAQQGVKLCIDVCHIFQGGMEYTKFREQLQEYNGKIFLYRISDLGERPHMQLGFGKIPYPKIIRNIREFEPFIVVDALLSVENELVARNPKAAIEKSLEYLKGL